MTADQRNASALIEKWGELSTDMEDDVGLFGAATVAGRQAVRAKTEMKNPE
jgi:hypothetical protein